MLSKYLEKTKDLPPSPPLVEALKYVRQKNSALDIGCGGGKDTKKLLEQGFKVTAIDKDPEVDEIMRSLPHQENLIFVNKDIIDFNFQKYDLINAHFSLPFIYPDKIQAVLKKIKSSINPGGVFVGQFFGKRDSWNTGHPNMNFFNELEAKAAFSDMKLLSFREEESDGQTTLGQPKRWHILHFIAQKTS